MQSQNKSNTFLLSHLKDVTELQQQIYLQIFTEKEVKVKATIYWVAVTSVPMDVSCLNDKTDIDVESSGAQW